MSEFVRFELRDDVAVLTMDDGKANALGHAMLDALLAALDRAEQEGRPVVIAGREQRFSGGFDLSEMMAGPDAVVGLVTKAVKLLVRLYTLPLPVVAACTGHAMAGGALMLLTADERIGADGPFKLGLNEVRIGIPLPHVGRELSRARLDPRKLTEAVMKAHIYTPAEAADVGFLDRVVAANDLMTAAIEEAQQLGQLNAEAYAKTKIGLREVTARFVLDSLDEDLQKMLPSAS